MQLTRIQSLTARLTLETGLHIGAGDTEMHIGGVDNPVIKNPITHQPYIPGSSLKGKMRSLLEWKSGAVKQVALGYKDFASAQGVQREQIGQIVRLFGISGSDQLDEKQALEIGPTRLAFWDCELSEESAKLPTEVQTEEKSEVSIDRISGTAKNGSLRNTERVPAGVAFDFRLSLKVLDNDADLLPAVLAGLRLIELDSLGGSGSRGYGKVRFADLKLDGQPIELPQDPFAAA